MFHQNFERPERRAARLNGPARSAAGWFNPLGAAVNTRKQNRLGKLAHGYLKLKRLRQVSCRFDVVSVIFNDEGAVKAIRHIPNAFSVSAW